MKKKLLQLHPNLISSERITPFRSAPKQAHPKSTLFKLSLLPLLLAALLTFVMGEEVKGQTNPTPQSIPLSQNFGTTSFSTLPNGFTAWNGTGLMATLSAAESSTPSGDATVTARTATTTTAGVYGLAISNNARVYIQTSGNTTNGTNQLALGLNTTGRENISLSFDVSVELPPDASRAYGVVAQYRVGNSGAWTTISGSAQEFTNQAAGTTVAKANLTLGSNANNQPEVQVRWATWRASGSGSSGGLSIDNISVTGDELIITEPTLLASPLNLVGFQYPEGSGPSAVQSFEVSGINLQSNLTITPPADFEISLFIDSGFTSSPLVLVEDEGEVVNTEIYVRLKSGLTVDTYSGNVTITSTNASTVNVSLSGEVIVPIFLIYEFTGNSVAPTQFPPNATTSDFQVSANSVGFGTAQAAEWGGSGVPYAESSGGWTSPTAENAKYFFFTVEPDFSYGITLTNISFQYRRTGAGPQNMTVEVNGTEVASVVNITQDTVFSFDEELFGFSNLNSVEVRIKGWNGGTGAFRLDDVRLDGEMVEDIYFATITERSGEGWRVLTSPVPGTSLATLLDPIWTQGPTGSNDPNTPAGNENILFLNTTTNQYEAPADMDREIADGEGFAVYVFARDDYEDENSVTWPKILTVPGQPRTSDLLLDNERLANAAGRFTLLGNPFAETISIGNFSAFSLNNVAEVFYVYDHDFSPLSFTEPDLPGDEPPAGPGGGFRAWNGTAGSLTGGLIAAFQGFYVETKGASPTLTIPASAVTTGGTLFGTPDSETFAFEIAARINQRQSGMTFFSFGEDGSLSFNQRDARMLYPLDFSPFLAIYSEADGQTTHIRHLPSELAEAVVLPLHIEAWQPNAGFTAFEPIQGSVEMVWPDVSNLPAAWTVTLTDTFTGVVLNLRETDRYDFVTGDDERSAGRTLTHELALRRVPATERAGTRFLLTIDPEMPTSAPVTGELPRALALSQNYPNPFNPTTMIRFEMPAAEEVRLEVYNVQGQRVAVLVNGTVQAGVHNVSFDASALSSGVYLYRLQAGSQVLTRKMTLIK